VFSSACYSQTPLPKNAKLKTIEYKSTDYVAIGYVYKKQFVEGQNITFLSKLTQDTIISGKYFTSGNIASINGVWKQNTKNGKTRVVGIFKIANSDIAYQLTTNPKEGKSLQIEVIDIFYYQGFHNNYPAVLEKQNEENYSLTVNYYDMAGKNRILIIKKELIEKYGWFAIDDFIYFTPNITIKYSNGDVFTGFTENTRIEDNMIGYKFREGVWTYANGDYNKRELIKLPDGNYKFNMVYSEHMKDNNFAQMEMIVNKSFIDKYGYWGQVDFMLNIPDIKYTYKNGNIFTGKQVSTTNNLNENSASINTKLTHGKLQYATGEVFDGDLSGQWFCGIPISGKMQFTDGSVENGNWLDKFNLSKEDSIKVTEVESPFKKRNIAKDLYKETQYRSAIDKASLALSEEKYHTAKSWYLKALSIKPEETELVNTRIEKIERLIIEEEEKKPIIEKYGEYWGNLVYNGKYTLGMNTSMVFDILLKNNAVKSMDDAIKIEILSLKGLGISTKGIGSSIKDCYSIENNKHGNQIVETYRFSKKKLINIFENVANRITDPELQMKIIQAVNSMKEMFNYSILGADPFKNQLPTFTFTDGKLSEIDYGFSNINILGY
jgi:hypothetical protein